jgi:hypothetical protein
MKMPLEPIQLQIIEEQLQKENVSEFITELLIGYSTDVNRTSQLLSLIPKIADMQLKIVKNEVVEHSLATNLLIGATDKKQNMDFATLMYVSKACFPYGNCNGASPAGERFFQKFVDAIKNKKEFNYESKDDWHWICDIAQCESWMKSVIMQNVAENK